MISKISKIFDESIQTIEDSKIIIEDVHKAIEIIKTCLKNNGKIIVFGNGGSAADAQHFVAEFIGRFEKERDSIPALALTTDTSIITAIGNDYGYEKIFSRQCEALLNSNDVVFAISTSGSSVNVINGVKIANQKKATVISLVGNNNNELKPLSDSCISIPSTSTARTQEVHRIILHIICKLIEDEI